MAEPPRVVVKKHKVKVGGGSSPALPPKPTARPPGGARGAGVAADASAVFAAQQQRQAQMQQRQAQLQQQQRQQQYYNSLSPQQKVAYQQQMRQQQMLQQQQQQAMMQQQMQQQAMQGGQQYTPQQQAQIRAQQMRLYQQKQAQQAAYQQKLAQQQAQQAAMHKQGQQAHAQPLPQALPELPDSPVPQPQPTVSKPPAPGAVALPQLPQMPQMPADLLDEPLVSKEAPAVDMPLPQPPAAVADASAMPLPQPPVAAAMPLPTPPVAMDVPLPQPPVSEDGPTDMPLPTPPPHATSMPLPTPPVVPRKPPSVPHKPPPPADKPSLPSKPPVSAPSVPHKPVSAPPGAAPPKPPGNEVVTELSWPVDKMKFEKPDDSSQIIYEQKEDEYSKPKIKAATIEKLIEKATCFSADSNIQKTLLLTYRSMITAEEFLDLLKERFCMPLPEGNETSVNAFRDKHQKPIQVRVCQVMKTWVTKYFYDFDGDTALQQKLLDFCVNIIKPVCPPGATLESIVQRQMSGEYEKSLTIQFTDPPPEPILPSCPRPSLLDIHPMEIARQLTLIESKLYRSIRPQECLGLAWSKKNASERAPNVLKMIERFNLVSNWVVSEVVRQDSQKQRVKYLAHFIEIADRCKGLNNFNACMEIISGLGDSSVHRLKSHWAELPKKTLNIYEEIRSILSSQHNYKNFRAYLKTCNGACIPYLGMYLTDLTFIEDGNNDKLGELHNISKRIFVSNVISEIQQYQQSPYILKDVPPIQNFFNRLDDKIIDKEQCYQISLQILPRGGAKAAASPAPTQKKPLTDDYGEMQQVPGYPFNEKDTPKNIRLQQNPNDPSGPQKVIGGVLEKIVERLTYKSLPDADFIDSFLLNYRSYTTGQKLFELLAARFNMPLPKEPDQMERFKKEQLLPVQLRVMNVLKNWVENYPYDFVTERELATSFFEFVNNNSTSMHAASLKRIAKTLKQKSAGRGDNRRATVTTASLPPPTHPLQAGADAKNPTFLDFHPEEVARQICLLDSELANRIQALELLDKLWESDPKRARNILLFMRRVSALKNWVVDQVITIEASNRRKMLAQLVAVTIHCYDMHNYNAMVGLLAGLQSPEVKSLTQTWEAIDGALVNRLKSIMSTGNQLTNLRVFREQVMQQCIDEASVFPIDGYLKEIEGIEEQDKAYIEGQIINMVKCRKLHSTIKEFLTCRNIPYNYTPEPWLQSYLSKEVGKFADRDGFSDQIPLSEQIAAMSLDKVKMAIRAEMMDDGGVKNELLKALKKALISEVATTELQTFTDEMESYKQQMRQELQLVHEKFGGDFTEEVGEEQLSEKFGADLDAMEDWVLEDQEGIVYGWPEQISVATLTTGSGDTYLIHQRKIFDKAELALLLRIQAFYEQYSGCESTPKLVALSSYVAPNVQSFAAQSGVELISVSAR